MHISNIIYTAVLIQNLFCKTRYLCNLIRSYVLLSKSSKAPIILNTDIPHSVHSNGTDGSRFLQSNQTLLVSSFVSRSVLVKTDESLTKEKQSEKRTQ